MGVDFKIIEPGSSVISEDILQSFEKIIGFALPKDYRAFLLENNGGYPEYENFHVKSKADIGIEGFSSIQIENGQPNYEEFYLEDPVLDQKFMVIGYDGCGNYLCMRKEGKDAGCIYFIDHDCDSHWEVEDIEQGSTEVAWCAFYKTHDNFSALREANCINEELEEEDY